jgi:hypothetical protein
MSIVLTQTGGDKQRLNRSHAWDLEEGGKGKENDRESTISKYIASVQVEDIRFCSESCSIMCRGGEG